MTFFSSQSTFLGFWKHELQQTRRAMTLFVLLVLTFLFEVLRERLRPSRLWFHLGGGGLLVLTAGTQNDAPSTENTHFTVYQN